MTSRIVFVLFAVQLLSAVAGVEVEHQAAYDRVLKCINEGFHAGKQEALKEESQPLDKKALLCHFWKGMYPCLTAPFNPMDGHSSEILDFYRAYEWQLGLVSEQSKLCTDLSLDDLEALVKQSGIMDKEHLPNIENDVYEPCVGEAHVKCMTGAEQAWEHHMNELDVFFTNINCYKSEAEKCSAPMLHDMNKFVQAFKKHLQEKHGLLAHMMEEITP